jgi:phospholipid/cholesterol/gamma-HCH transport system substrate-binding protein
MPYPREIALAKFRVTAVIICALCIMAVLVYLLTGGSIFSAKAPLFLYIPDATGIASKSPVRVNGIVVGKVDSVELSGSADPSRVVRVRMIIETQYLDTIPLDSLAEVTADTLIGDLVIQISSGKQNERVKPGGEIRFQPPTDLMKSLDITQFDQQLRKVDALLTQLEEGRTPLGEFVRGEAMYTNLVQRTAELQAGIRRAVGTTGQVGSLLYSDALYRQILAPIRQLDDALAAVQSGQGAAGRLVRDTADYDKLRETIASLRRNLAELQQGRGGAAEFLNSDAAWESLNKQVTSMIAAVDRVNTNPLLATTEAYDYWNGAAAEMAKTIADFQKNPKKYLRLKVF